MVGPLTTHCWYNSQLSVRWTGAVWCLVLVDCPVYLLMTGPRRQRQRVSGDSTGKGGFERYDSKCVSLEKVILPV